MLPRLAAERNPEAGPLASWRAQGHAERARVAGVHILGRAAPKRADTGRGFQVAPLRGAGREGPTP